MKQQCHIAFVYSSLFILVGGIVFFLVRGLYIQTIFWVIFIILFLRIYVRYFPFISSYMGYGSVDDEPGNRLDQTHVDVTLYTGMGCPFCPIVKNRLKELQPRMEFKLKEIDITLKPDIIISKGIRAIPVVEVGRARWVGNATTDQLVKFIMEASIPKFATA